MLYEYVGNGNFLQGLPAVDLDDSTLTDDQKILLEVAVEGGLYKPKQVVKESDSGKSSKSRTTQTFNEGPQSDGN